MRKYIFAYESEIIRGNAEAGRIAQSCPRHRQRATKKMALAANACSRSAALRIACATTALCPRSPRRAIRYMPASMIPHARLQPSAAISIRSRDTDGVRDRQRHDQAEQNFGEPFNRFEYTPKQPHRIRQRTHIL